jgi:hypothetical protein
MSRKILNLQPPCHVADVVYCLWMSHLHRAACDQRANNLAYRGVIMLIRTGRAIHVSWRAPALSMLYEPVIRANRKNGLNHRERSWSNWLIEWPSQQRIGWWSPTMYILLMRLVLVTVLQGHDLCLCPSRTLNKIKIDVDDEIFRFWLHIITLTCASKSIDDVGGKKEKRKERDKGCTVNDCTFVRLFADVTAYWSWTKLQPNTRFLTITTTTRQSQIAITVPSSVENLNIYTK